MKRTLPDPRQRRIGNENRELTSRLLSSLAVYPFTERLRMSSQEYGILVARARADAANHNLRPYFPLQGPHCPGFSEEEADLPTAMSASARRLAEEPNSTIPGQSWWSVIVDADVLEFQPARHLSQSLGFSKWLIVRTPNEFHLG